MFSLLVMLLAFVRLWRMRLRRVLAADRGRLRVVFGGSFALLMLWLFSASSVMAQTSGTQSTGGDSGSIFGYEVSESRIAYTGLAALLSPVLVSLIAKLGTKGYQKTLLNVGLALLFAAGSWFVDKFGTSEYVIQALSIFVIASGIFFANQGGFRSLTANVGRK